jgi:simple sugar transport system ATP-binding protein
VVGERGPEAGEGEIGLLMAGIQDDEQTHKKTSEKGLHS